MGNYSSNMREENSVSDKELFTMQSSSEEKAIQNYANYHGLPKDLVTIDNVINSSGGLDGWFKNMEDAADSNLPINDDSFLKKKKNCSYCD